MPNKEDLLVGGYFFGSYDDANQAKRELKKAQYLEERVNSMNAKQLKAVYDKMLDEKMFSTPVGWEYLKYVQERLKAEGISENEIRPIPLYATFTSSSKDNNEYSHIAKMHIKNNRAVVPRLKNQLKTSVLVNIALIVLAIVMFVITLNSSNPNILNYKQAITDEYASWEQELTERENALKEKESTYENFNG